MPRLLFLLCAAGFAGAQTVPETTLVASFTTPTEGCVLRAHGGGSAPRLVEGSLSLLDGRGNNSAAWQVCADGGYRRIEARAVVRLEPGLRGFSLMLLHSNHFGASGPAFELYKPLALPGAPAPAAPTWDEPNLWGSFALALDTHNPPSDDPFDANGNIHERPERELSLHFDGREVANAFCPVELVTGAAVAVELALELVTGGAEVSVTVDGAAVYDRHFIPHLMPYESRVAVGAYGPEGGRCVLDSLSVAWIRPAAPSPPPVTVAVLSRGGPRATARELELLPAELDFERVILRYHLRPLVRRDEWDRLGWLRVFDGEESFELARILTPFSMWGADYPYEVDVSDFRWLLYGRKRVDFAPRRGFVTDLSLIGYRRPPDVAPRPRVLAMDNVWQGVARFNDPDSVTRTFGVRTVEVPPEATGAKLRICVTGHGGKGEFTPLQRTVRVGGARFENTLWTRDAYLNPWRPQFGTWKYDRAGWGPGSLGRVWELDLGGLIEPGQPLELEYTTETIESDSWDNHHVESQVIFYAD